MLLGTLVKGITRRSQSLASAPGRGAMPVVLEGQILKKGVVVSTWKSRWCTVEGPDVTGHHWLYYSDDRTSPSRGTFSLKGSFCIITRSKKHDWVLEVTWPGDAESLPRRFAFADAKQLQHWYDSIVQVNGQQSRPQSDEARRREDAQREQQRLAVRVQMVSFKAVWMPQLVDGSVECRGCVWTFSSVGSFRCTEGDWEGVSGTFCDAEDAVAISMELDRGCPPVRATLSPAGLDFRFLEASWLVDMDADTGMPVNVEGLDTEHRIVGQVPHFLALFVSSLDLWKSRNMMADHMDRVRLQAWKAEKWAAISRFWDHPCPNSSSASITRGAPGRDRVWLYCADCAFVWCSHDGASRCFSGSVARECNRCHNHSGQVPPPNAAALPDPLEHQLHGYPYPQVDWVKYMM